VRYYVFNQVEVSLIGTNLSQLVLVLAILPMVIDAKVCFYLVDHVFRFADYSFCLFFTLIKSFFRKWKARDLKYM